MEVRLFIIAQNLFKHFLWFLFSSSRGKTILSAWLCVWRGILYYSCSQSCKKRVWDSPKDKGANKPGGTDPIRYGGRGSGWTLRVLLPLLLQNERLIWGIKGTLNCHFIVENNDSDVEDGGRIKPVSNLRCLHQKRTNENEVRWKKSRDLIGFPIMLLNILCSLS